jgi:hypothetical protein
LEHAEQRVTSFVVRRPSPLCFRDHHVTGGAELDLLERIGQIAMMHDVLSAPRGEESSLVDQVREVRARHTGR